MEVADAISYINWGALTWKQYLYSPVASWLPLIVDWLVPYYLLRYLTAALKQVQYLHIMLRGGVPVTVVIGELVNLVTSLPV